MIGENPFREGWVLIEDAVLSAQSCHRQLSTHANEAGGILIGYRRGPHLHIVDSSAPLRGDRGTRLSFHRSARGHAAFALARWRVSGKTCDYLGEWHTHPEVEPSPSSIDLREWHMMVKRRRDPMVFVILGTSGIWAGVGMRGEIRPVRFHPEP